MNDFISFNKTNKVILFYRQNCNYCKAEIIDLNLIADRLNTNIEYAIVDVTNDLKYCLKNTIIKFPTINIYRDNILYKQIEERKPIEELEKEISEITI